jgi:hypothetical protein
VTSTPPLDAEVGGEAGPESAAVVRPARLCLFTTLLGQYEELNEQPVAAGSTIPFLCLTDDPDLRSDSWQIKQVAPVFGMDPIRSQRDLKIRPHVHLPDFDASIYIDNSVLLTEPPERLFERYNPVSGFCLPRHSFRDSVLDEFVAATRLGLDDQSRIFEQLSHYSIDFPGVLEEQPYWTGILLRDHRDPVVRAMLEIWAAHVHRYSRRDQLSVNVAFRQAGLTPKVMDIDNHASWFHSWPHKVGRGRAREMSGRAASSGTPVAQHPQLEQELATQAQRQEVLLAVPTWRVAALLGTWAGRHPHFARFLWRVLRPFF